MRAVSLFVLLLMLLSGCGPSGPVPRTADAAAMFAPVSMRIHPIFSGIKDWTGDNKPDGLEANLEFEDQFGERYVRPGMLPLLTQVTEHCSTTRIRMEPLYGCNHTRPTLLPVCSALA